MEDGVGGTGRVAVKPYVYFDLGETIVNLRDTIPVLAALLGRSYPAIASDATDLAKTWFLGLARSVPREPTATFETQYDVGRKVLARLVRERGVSIDDFVAGRLLRTAWDQWQDRARLCEGVTKDWLGEVRRLAAGVGAVTDGDEADVRRLLEKTGLLPYFDSVTTSEAVSAYKPNPVVYRTALASLHADPRKSIFVSDSSLDLTGAHAVGMAVAWFHPNPSEDPVGLPPGAVRVTRPNQLSRILTKFAKTGHFEAF